MLPIPIAGPAVEPVTTLEMRGALRLDDGAEDAFVTALVGAARAHIEDATGRRLIEQSWRMTLPAWPRGRVVTLPLSPVMRIERVRVVDRQGQPSDLAPALYRLERTDPPRLVVDRAAPDPGSVAEGIAIDIVAGFGAAATDVPAPLVQAIRLFVVHWFEHRGDDRDPAPLPPDVPALIAPYRVRRIA